jgi:hypothetical protein
VPVSRSRCRRQPGDRADFIRIQRLGVESALQELGAVHGHENTCTKHGWIRENGIPRRRPEHGLNVRRQTLDPLMRATAATVPSVTLMILGAQGVMSSFSLSVLGLRRR